jgi:hypothetical protein
MLSLSFLIKRLFRRLNMTVLSINSGTNLTIPISPIGRYTVADKVFETATTSKLTPAEEVTVNLIEGGALKGGVTVFNVVKDDIAQVIPKKGKGIFGENLYKVLFNDKQVISQNRTDFEKSPFKKFSFKGSSSITFEPYSEECIKISITDEFNKQIVLYADKNSSKAYKHPFSSILTKEEALQKLESLLKTTEVMVAVFNRHGVAAFCRKEGEDNPFFKYDLYWTNSQEDFSELKKVSGLCQGKTVKKIGSSCLSDSEHEGYRCVPFSVLQIYQLTACSEDVNFKYEHQLEQDQKYSSQLNGEDAEVIHLQQGFQENLRKAQKEEDMGSCLGKRFSKLDMFF